jgi:hypothetical protein
MDPNGNIYPIPTGQANPEDEARLDGYLKARAEADAAAHAEHLAAMEVKVRELQEKADRG